MKRVVLVDDYGEIAALIAVLLSDEFDVVATFRTANDLIKWDGLEDIDVVVADHAMPDITGAELFRILKEQYPHIRRVLISAQFPSDESKEFADAFVDKSQLYDKLFNAINGDE